MLILIPTEHKPSWHRMPYVTIVLFLISVLVFITYQSFDENKADEAYQYYFTSGLAEREVPRYLQFLSDNGQKKDAILYRNRWERDPGEFAPEIFGLLQFDKDFVTALRADTIIKPSEYQYGDWKQQRSHFDLLWQSQSSVQYGFVPANPSVVTLFTHSFLHGGWDHLIGNMIFFLLVAVAMESAYGSLVFLCMYIAVIAGSVSFYWLMNMGQAIPLIGASGAVSGVMALYAATFGLRKIQFFYWLLFIFNNVRAPAWILLPLWIGNEVVSAIMYPESNVAYSVHVGGFIAGAICGYVGLKLKLVRDHTYEETDTREVGQWIDQSDAALDRLDFDSARKILKEGLEKYPERHELIRKLTWLESSDMSSPRYAEAMQRVRDLPDSKENNAFKHEMFKHYLDNSSSLRLPFALATDSALHLLALGYLHVADALTRQIVANGKKHASVKQLLQGLLKAHAGSDKAADFEILLKAKYPEVAG